MKRGQSWCHANRLTLAVVLVVVSAGYAVLAVFNDNLARTIGVGYIVVVLTLGFLLRLPSHDR